MVNKNWFEIKTYKSVTQMYFSGAWILSFNDIMLGVAVGVSTAIITTGITFYLKDYLMERAKFNKFKKKLEEFRCKEVKNILFEPYIKMLKYNYI